MNYHRVSLLAAGILLLVKVSLGQSPARLAGTWECVSDGTRQLLVFKNDGSGMLNEEPMQYRVLENQLVVTTSAGTTTYLFKIEGNKLSVSGGDLDGILIFTRSQAKPASPSFSNTAKEILGTWSGEGEIIEFRPDGSCRYNDAQMMYKLSQGNVILETATGTVAFGYSVKANRLTLTANGQQAVYDRVSTPKPSAPTKSQARNPVDLVGQWCYMKSSTDTYSGRCITLNADGTYVYAEERSMSVQAETLAGGTSSQGSDSGTWYVQGDRLYYQSATRGNGSYRLERRNHPKNVNDPMIMLDDEPYVTTTRRPPWR